MGKNHHQVNAFNAGFPPLPRSGAEADSAEYKKRLQVWNRRNKVANDLDVTITKQNKNILQQAFNIVTKPFSVIYQDAKGIVGGIEHNITHAFDKTLDTVGDLGKDAAQLGGDVASALSLPLTIIAVGAGGFFLWRSGILGGGN
jgi:hypothetical protein